MDSDLDFKVEILNKLGVFAVEVDALTPEVKHFYCKLGFTPLVDDHLHLFISIKTIRRLFQH